jgi:hypothetical protein
MTPLDYKSYLNARSFLYFIAAQLHIFWLNKIKSVTISKEIEGFMKAME